MSLIIGSEAEHDDFYSVVEIKSDHVAKKVGCTLYEKGEVPLGEWRTTELEVTP